MKISFVFRISVLAFLVMHAGFCYAQQAVLFNLPAEAHDMALDWVITPVKAHSFVKKDA